MDDDDVLAQAGFGITTAPGSGDINYFFPVTVEVHVVAADADQVAEQVLDKLAEGLDSE